MQARFADLIVETRVGDIAAQDDCDAVVNAANAQLMPGGGVAGALHRAAGPELAEACRPLAPIQPGQAVITSGFALPNRHVIHCLGPVYGVDEPGEQLLAACYRNALRRAEEHWLTSLAMPALSTGAFGFPMERAARVAVGTLRSTAAQLRHVRRACFVLADESARSIHDQVIQELAEEQGG
ncbi:MAG: macro domain-containing protein [Halorhodospira halophila]|uniref:macro domain-containing protein n=1 Tax=Halorhodospira TaxID=85108 RepID=UPI0019122828|nr:MULTISPECIES: macro domain-containing protein [Halorhodospira]MBK5935396.1 RNase III inhibitor [Halorhodospira halophila]MBK5943230.1 RNase III inhibitor [Halorhodospira halophila]MCC3751190.1 macro domain-containing protein [Halorhodospira halophila]MCG5526752.1 macro domain-containing protein [Halorhodospira halophila]MCG5533806.1 macro domain-containing protein [Halorhodospira sp. 9621]